MHPCLLAHRRTGTPRGGGWQALDFLFDELFIPGSLSFVWTLQLHGCEL